MARVIEAGVVDRLASSATSSGIGVEEIWTCGEQCGQLLGGHGTHGLGQGAWPRRLARRGHPAYLQGDRYVGGGGVEVSDLRRR